MVGGLTVCQKRSPESVKYVPHIGFVKTQLFQLYMDSMSMSQRLKQGGVVDFQVKRIKFLATTTSAGHFVYLVAAQGSLLSIQRWLGLGWAECHKSRASMATQRLQSNSYIM